MPFIIANQRFDKADHSAASLSHLSRFIASDAFEVRCGELILLAQRVGNTQYDRPIILEQGSDFDLCTLDDVGDTLASFEHDLTVPLEAYRRTGVDACPAVGMPMNAFFDVVGNRRQIFTDAIS